MKNTNAEFNTFSHLKRNANINEHYFLTIIDDSGIATINLNQFSKTKISFGRNTDNDIVINSDVLDSYQGYLEITDYGVLAVNTSSTVSMLGNHNKTFDNFYLSEGNFIKLLPNVSNSSFGVLLIMSIGTSADEWKQYNLQTGNNFIGSSNSCDIILPPNGIAKKHALINHSKSKTTLIDQNTLNGTYINGIQSPANSETRLNNLDVIYIGNTKIILFNDFLIYQIFDRGVQLDAIDIVKRVRIKFKTREISSHINMSIKPAEFVAFVGGSGAGKSTFLKCISGVDKPTSGKVLLDGEDLYDNFEHLKYNIGYVPQEDIVYSNLTLIDMLHYSAKLRMPDNTTLKARSERIKEVINIVQLSGLENTLIKRLSGGQRKRASIAVELIADPNLLFLDEPTSGLDPGTERSIMKTLRSMSEMGKTIILVTHNTLNLHLCDKVAFFGSKGRLCFYGTPQEALEFYGVDDFVDIYTLLNENTDEWYNKFQNIQEEVVLDNIPNKKNNKIQYPKKSLFRQLLFLISRNIKLIKNDVQRLLILFAQTPILALLIASISNSKVYSFYADTKGLLFAIGCASIWLGLLNAIQEICKEKVILQKEYMTDLKLSSYLLSKFIVQAILAFFQAFLLVSIFQLVAGKSQYSILINSFWDIQLICFMTIFASSSLGLFISSLVKNSSIALTIAPLVLVPQLLFSGILFELKGFSEFISNFILCRWTVEGLGTSVNLNGLTRVEEILNPLIVIPPEDYFLFTSEHMLKVILIINLMSLVLMILSYFALRKNIHDKL